MRGAERGQQNWKSVSLQSTVLRSVSYKKMSETYEASPGNTKYLVFPSGAKLAPAVRLTGLKINLTPARLGRDPNSRHFFIRYGGGSRSTGSSLAGIHRYEESGLVSFKLPCFSW